jgi:hypothetical protein
VRAGQAVRGAWPGTLHAWGVRGARARTTTHTLRAAVKCSALLADGSGREMQPARTSSESAAAWRLEDVTWDEAQARARRGLGARAYVRAHRVPVPVPRFI